MPWAPPPPAYPPAFSPASAYPPATPYPPAPAPGRGSRRRLGVWVGGGALLAAVSLGAGLAIGANLPGNSGSRTSSLQWPFGSGSGGTTGGGTGGSGSGGSGSGSGGSGSGSGGSGQTNPGGGFGFRVPGSGGSSGSGGTSTMTPPGSATAAQEVGVVDIDTVLGYQGAAAAGTGMILTANGEVLTNNHVVASATSIHVTVVATGATYTATVVGTDPTQDVAVIQLRGASGLRTVTAYSGTATTGASVTGVGNAGGRGGVPSAARGTVTATGQTITASDEDGSNPETLHGLIQINADIQPGDSGGPLYDAAGKVIGMDTAVEMNTDGSTAAGYAIPIGTATGIAQQIESGQASSTVHLGYPAFLGVSVSGSQTTTGGAVVQQVLSGTPAAQTGIVAGDVITAVGGQAVDSVDGLLAVLQGYRPGQQVSVTWSDAAGASHSATVTLMQGPPD
ncbi:MAG: PDZ domain-containing protein [Jatrophihabitans sp.]|nr:MAG: PDZ domain-containing protein [Jatrophihabitans sp.]